MARADQRQITVVLGSPAAAADTAGVFPTGSFSLGVMDTKSGGAIVSETTKARPGGMADEKDYGGFVTVEDIELTAIYDLDIIHALMPDVRDLVGVPESAIVTEQPLDRDGNAKGTPDVYKGTLSSVAPPDYDANATGDVGKLTITVSVSGEVG